MRLPKDIQVFGLIALATCLWYIIFGLKLVNFWLGMACAASVLASLGIFISGFPLSRQDINWRHAFLGVLTAVALYLIFYLGYHISQFLFPFAKGQVGAIYNIRTEAHPWLIVLVLLFITSPAEELFWRGFLQTWAVKRFGAYPGWLLASSVYGGVHVLSGNFMLTGAALVAGLFWGLVYLKTNSLFTCIVSHALWTVGIFIFFPVG